MCSDRVRTRTKNFSARKSRTCTPSGERESVGTSYSDSSTDFSKHFSKSKSNLKENLKMIFKKGMEFICKCIFVYISVFL